MFLHYHLITWNSWYFLAFLQRSCVVSIYNILIWVPRVGVKRVKDEPRFYASRMPISASEWSRQSRKRGYIMTHALEPFQSSKCLCLVFQNIVRCFPNSRDSLITMLVPSCWPPVL